MAPGSDSDSISASSSSGKKRKGGAGEGEEGFAEFWSSYPKKRGKQDALAAWRRLAPNVSLRGAMLLALERQKRWADWSRENGRYIPNPATWLNGRRWEDGDPQPLGGGHSDLFNQQVEILKDFVGRGGTEADDAK